MIGSDNLGELIQNLDADIRKQLKRCPCNVTFRFGNQGTLTSQQALVIPLGPLQLKVSTVQGGTPFLISNTLMRTLAAQIDCREQKLSSRMFLRPVQLNLTPKGLFLIDMNEIIRTAMDNMQAGSKNLASVSAET